MQTEAGTSLKSATSSNATRRARWRPHLTAVVLGVGIVVWGLDRLTKAWALRELVPGVPRPLIGDLLQLNLLFNPGAAFSLGTGVTPVFAAIQAAVSVAVVVAAFRVGSLWWALGLGLVLGGAAGNLTDRLTRPPSFGHGHVVDFLQLPYWPVFNIADSAICVAAVVLALTAFRDIGFDGSRADGSRADGSGFDGSRASAGGDEPTARTQAPQGPEQPHA